MLSINLLVTIVNIFVIMAICAIVYFMISNKRKSAK